MNRRTTILTWVALGAVLALHGTSEAHAAESEAIWASEVPQVVRLDLSAEEICGQTSWYPIAISPNLEPTGCVSTLDSGGFVWLNLPQEVFQESHVRMGFLVPDAPLPGVTPFGLLLLNHAIVALLFEQQGIAVALIADNLEIPPAPAFVEGEIAGVIAYGAPFEVGVHARMDRHQLAVSQDAVEIASARVDKAGPHAEPIAFVSYFIAPGPIRNLDWFFEGAAFKGIKPVSGDYPFGPSLGSLRAARVGNAIRVTRLY